ncbi:hypothetical protein M9458_038413, partial [Cirrhinus mrigala]
EAAAPRTPGLSGERVRPPDSAPYLDPSLLEHYPSFTEPHHFEDTRSPFCFGHFFPLFGHFVL